MEQTLPFPSERPPKYIKLEGEPVFDTSKHLALGAPKTVISLMRRSYDQRHVHRRLGYRHGYQCQRCFSDDETRLCINDQIVDTKEIACAVLFLARERHITGTILSVDGGYTAQ